MVFVDLVNFAAKLIVVGAVLRLLETSFAKSGNTATQQAGDALRFIY